MTRGYVKEPAWTWYCDVCGTSSGDVAQTQQLLPSTTTMRERGWYVAKMWGDMCPTCFEKDKEHNGGSQS